MPWHAGCRGATRVTEWGGQQGVTLTPIPAETGAIYPAENSPGRIRISGFLDRRLAVRNSLNRLFFFERRVYLARFRRVYVEGVDAVLHGGCRIFLPAQVSLDFKLLPHAESVLCEYVTSGPGSPRDN